MIQDIKDVIYSWITAMMTDVTVIWGDSEGPRPSGDYIRMTQISGIGSKDFLSEMRVPKKDSESDYWRFLSNKTFSVSFSAFGSSAMEWMTFLQMATSHGSIQDGLHRRKTVSITCETPVVGRVYSITADGVKISVTATAGMTKAQLISALAAEFPVNGDSNYDVSATASGTTLSVYSIPGLYFLVEVSTGLTISATVEPVYLGIASRSDVRDIGTMHGNKKEPAANLDIDFSFRALLPVDGEFIESVKLTGDDGSSVIVSKE